MTSSSMLLASVAFVALVAVIVALLQEIANLRSLLVDQQKRTDSITRDLYEIKYGSIGSRVEVLHCLVPQTGSLTDMPIDHWCTDRHASSTPLTS